MISRRKYFQPLFAFCSLLVCATLLGCSHYTSQAQRALDLQNYEIAEELAGQALQANPRDPVALLIVSEVNLALGNLEPALHNARLARRDPRYANQANYLIGAIYLALNQPVQTIRMWRDLVDDSTFKHPDREEYVEALEQAIERSAALPDYASLIEMILLLQAIDPSHVRGSNDALKRARERYARQLVEQRELSKAVQVYSELYLIDPGTESYLIELGRLYLALEQRGEALEKWRKYIDAEDLDAERFQRIQSIAAICKEHDELGIAESFFQDFLDEYREKLSSRMLASVSRELAMLAIASQDATRAEEFLYKYLDLSRGIDQDTVGIHQRTMDVADHALSHGQVDLAVGLLEQHCLRTQCPWIMVQRLAEVYSDRALYEEVVGVLARFAEQSNDTHSALLRVGQWALGRRNFELAREYFEKALTMEAEIEYSILLDVIEVYAELRMSDRIDQTMHAFVSGHMSEFHAWLELASKLSALGYLDHVERSLLAAFRIDSSSTQVIDKLVAFYQTHEQYQKMHSYIERWIAVRGDQIEDYIWAGDRLLRARAGAEANRYFEHAANHGHYGAWLQIADVYRSQGRHVRMKHAFDAYLQRASNPVSALNDIVSRYHTAGLIVEAIPYLEKQIEYEPHEFRHYEVLARAYLELDRKRDILRIWHRFVGTTSGDAEKRIAMMAMRLTQPRLALQFIAFLDDVIQSSVHSSVRTSLYRILGDTCLRLAEAVSRPRHATTIGVSSEQLRRRAKDAYAQYLSDEGHRGADLVSLASRLAKNQMWELAASAYFQAVDRGVVGGNDLYFFATAQLRSGDVEQALGLYGDFFRASSDSVDAAKSIAQQLLEERMLRHAESYLRHVFSEATTSEDLQWAFIGLTHVYASGDEIDVLPSLNEEYLERSSNKLLARRHILTLMTNLGQWGFASEHLRYLSISRDESYAFQAGVVSFRDGLLDDAKASFGQYVHEHPSAAMGWLSVGEFYEHHGYFELARAAYENVLSERAHEPIGHFARGRVLLRLGHVEDALADFEKLDSGLSPELIHNAIQTLIETGHFRHARRFAEKALRSDTPHREEYLFLVAQEELSRLGSGFVESYALSLKNEGMPIQELVILLDAFGMPELAVDLITNEIELGNYAAITQVLRERPHLLTRRNGIEQLKNIADRLIREHPQTSSAFIGHLGSFLVEEGHLEEGVRYLRKSVEQGQRHFAPMLMHVYLQAGFIEHGIRYAREHLYDVPLHLLETELRSVQRRFEISDQRVHFRNLLEDLAHHSPAYAQTSIPMIIEDLLNRGDYKSAMDALIAGPWTEGIDAGSPALSWFSQLYDRAPSILADILVRCLELIAARGLWVEVNTIIESLDGKVANEDLLQAFRVRVLAARSSDDDHEELLRDHVNPDMSPQERVFAARQLNLTGEFEWADELVHPLLDSPRVTTSTEALDILVSNAVARGQFDNARKLADSYITNNDDKFGARTLVSNVLARYGLNELAFTFLIENFKNAPNETHATAALESLMASGMLGENLGTLAHLLRTVESPKKQLDRLFSQISPDADNRSFEQLIVWANEILPSQFDNLVREARYRYQIGDVSRARELLRSYLQREDYDPPAVEKVFQVLDAEGLSVELARYFAIDIPAENYTAHAWRYLALAQYGLGLEAQALDSFDNAIVNAFDSHEAASTIAKILIDRNAYDLAFKYSQEALDHNPHGAQARLFHGISALGLGEVEFAKKFLDVELKNGHNRVLQLYRAARAALHSGKSVVAVQYLNELAATPMLDDSRLHYPLQLVLSLLVDYSHIEDAFIAWRDAHAELFEHPTLLRREVTDLLALLLVRHGEAESARSLYHELIARALIVERESKRLPALWNNFASLFSDADSDRDWAVALSRRAIATGEASASYFDTYGWLLFKSGDIDGAYAHVRQALRESRGESSAARKEVLQHFVEILHARGEEERAIWMQIYVDRLP